MRSDPELVRTPGGCKRSRWLLGVCEEDVEAATIVALLGAPMRVDVVGHADGQAVVRQFVLILAHGVVHMHSVGLVAGVATKHRIPHVVPGDAQLFRDGVMEAPRELRDVARKSLEAFSAFCVRGAPVGLRLILEEYLVPDDFLHRLSSKRCQGRAKAAVRPELLGLGVGLAEELVGRVGLADANTLLLQNSTDLGCARIAIACQGDVEGVPHVPGTSLDTALSRAIPPFLLFPGELLGKHVLDLGHGLFGGEFDLLLQWLLNVVVFLLPRVELLLGDTLKIVGLDVHVFLTLHVAQEPHRPPVFRLIILDQDAHRPVEVRPRSQARQLHNDARLESRLVNDHRFIIIDLLDLVVVHDFRIVIR
mmetsp:Transcript_121626/g.259621  ORF Transcript_121626/g.259621 Transcript_121626/m.259621 type:complete len:364 (+) Transcript_121626:408-1499(+)